jgi:hypothetical protein
MDALDVVPVCGLVDALLEVEDVPLDGFPGERFPIFST